MGEQSPPAAPVIETTAVERSAASRRQRVIDLRTAPVIDRFDLVTVAVTGGSGLLGSAIATELVRRGARVIVLGRELARLNQVDQASGAPARMVALECDLGSVAAVESAADFMVRMGIAIDVVVHAAGVQSSEGIRHGAVDDLDEQYLINLRAPYLLTQMLEPAMSPRPHVVLLTAGSDASSEVYGAQFLMIQRSLESFGQLLRQEFPSMRVTTLRPALHPDESLRIPETVEAVIFALTAPQSVEPSVVRSAPVAGSTGIHHTPVTGAAWS